MNIDNKTYKKYAKAHAPSSPIVKNMLFAFSVGGGICVLGEGIIMTAQNVFGFDRQNAGLICSIILIAISVILTSVGVFDKIAKHAGAGTLVPITGFANAVASSAIDSKNEGFILGLGAKIFLVAGPVLLYSVIGGSVYGVIYYIMSFWR